jgi:hypothetical protein
MDIVEKLHHRTLKCIVNDLFLDFDCSKTQRELAYDIGSVVPEDLLQEYLEGQKENDPPAHLSNKRTKVMRNYLHSPSIESLSFEEGDGSAISEEEKEKQDKKPKIDQFIVGQHVWWEDYPEKCSPENPGLPIVFAGRVVFTQKRIARVQPVRTTCFLEKMEWSADWSVPVGQFVNVALKRLRVLYIRGKPVV